MMLKLRTIGSKYLTSGTNYIKIPTTTKQAEKLKLLVSTMNNMLTDLGGVGLAAPQVGHKERMFIVSYGDFKQTFINPIITETSDECIADVESCLSVPDRAVIVKRPDQIHIDYYDENLVLHHGKFKGFLARIVQHEYDHLKGKLITDYR